MRGFIILIITCLLIIPQPAMAFFDKDERGPQVLTIPQNFPSALQYYEQLVEEDPSLGNQTTLSSLYMENKNFAKAQEILESLCQQNPNDPKLIKSYLECLVAQRKIYEAYSLIREHNLWDTKEAYVVLGDLNLKNKMYDAAATNYFKALKLDPEDIVLKNNLAYSYRMMGFIQSSTRLHKEVLAKDPKNIDARLGLGFLEMDKKNFKKARDIFNAILMDKPDFRPAKIAMAKSYIANNEKLSALDVLDKLPDDDESKLMKAQIYYDFKMKTDAKDQLKEVYTSDAEKLNFKIKQDDAFTIIPNYSFFFQKLADEFRLNYQKYGIQISKNVPQNANIFMEYNVYWYSNGSPSYLNNVTHEFKGGVQSRPTTKIEYRADLGVKSFEFGDGMILTNSWFKYRFNDKFNLKLGFYRNNLEQSYTSAVGQYIDNVFTGRVADNRLYSEYNLNLPHQSYIFGRGVYGLLTAQNLPTNQYLEGVIGIGKRIYHNPRNKWIKTINVDLTNYTSAYQYNLLNLYSRSGRLFGGYFSPSFFDAPTLNAKVEGKIEKWKLRYGITAFSGPQIAMSQDFTRLSWGVETYASYDLNDHVSINVSYNSYTFADVQRHLFMVNAVIRGFRRNAKK